MPFVPFLQISGKKIATVKPNPFLFRKWSRTNPVVRRCIDIIADKLASLPCEFYGEDKKKVEIWSNVLSKPNNDDNQNKFMRSISEDLVTGDCGCFEVSKTGNPFRPCFLFPTDGFTMDIVLNDDNYAYAQKISDNLVSMPNNYTFFKKDEIVYLKKHCFTNTPYGLSPIESAFDYISSLFGTFRYSADIASNAMPKYLANVKGLAPNRLEAYRSYFVNECMGQPNLPIVSADAIESKQIAPISEEATFMSYQQFVMAVIAFSFGVPPEKLAIAKSNDRSTTADIAEELLADAVIPYSAVIVDAINQLLDINNATDVRFRFIFAQSLDSQIKDQDKNVSLYTKDILTRNEVREKLGYPPLKDGFSDDCITVAKAKINKKYGINGFGTPKETGGKKNE